MATKSKSLVEYTNGSALSMDALSQEGAEDVVRKALFPEDKPQPTYQELSLFIAMCRSRHLDPFAKEAYLIKYSEKSPATMVVSKDAFMERANRHEAFDGMVAGLIVQRGDKIEFTEGTFHLPSDVLLGGWARVYRKDRKHPSYQSPLMAEYNSHQGLWPKIPATMIRKVAVVQALREAFPEDFGGLYDASEMQQSVQSSNVDLLAETGVTHVVPETILTELPAPPSVPTTQVQANVAPVQTVPGGGICPLHNVAFDPFSDFKTGKPGHRHQHGVWDKDLYAGKPYAGRTRWCNQDSKEVQDAYASQPVQTVEPVVVHEEEPLPVEEDDIPDLPDPY